MKRPELARAEAQGEHKKEQAECHKSAVGTGGSQPHRKHPRSVQGGGFGFLRRDFGLWVGAAVLRIHESGDSSPKELSLAAESLEGSTRTWGSGPSGSEPGDTELHRNSWWSVSTLNQVVQSPGEDIAGDSPAWTQHARKMCNLPLPDSRILLKNFALIYLRQCYCDLYWAEILRGLNEDFISWL